VNRSAAMNARLEALSWATAALLAAALVAMALISPATEAAQDAARRAEFIHRHPMLWRGAWLTTLAAMGALCCFFVAWGRRLPPRPAWAVQGLSLAAVLADGSGLALLIVRSSEDLAWAYPTAVFLTSGIATSLWTLVGVLLTLHTPTLGRATRRLAWITWCAGACLAVGGLVDNLPLRVLGAMGMFPLMPVVCYWVGRDLRGTEGAATHSTSAPAVAARAQPGQ
jgi:hypothetical protein